VEISLPSSRRQPDARRKTLLKLSGQIEGQLRDIYARKHEAGEINQTVLAAKLGVDRSAINRRLSGRSNMTIETIADLIWGLDSDFDLKIFERVGSVKNSGLTPGGSDGQVVTPDVKTNVGGVLTPATASSGPRTLTFAS